ncbi:MAG TPA: hypothetical protein VI462_10785 [Acidimicrobiia bacterium]
MKSRLVLIVEASLLAGALALAAPAAAGAASPAKGGHGSTTTTTTTKPGSSSGSAAAFATLVIKPASIGHVSVEQAGTSSFTPGTNNEQLHVGDTVQTDTVGLAEIDYATNAYTRLDVNTTFMIKKLTDNQGNRQIDGGLTSGETWNRTAELTQSESFQQDGGGVSAAVSGTAFVADCTTSTACTFTAVIDNTNLTGPNGQTETLNPLTQCVTQNAALCASPTMLTPDQLALIRWIQYNVLLDFTEHGIGNGIFDPFGATVTVTNGVVTSVTPSGGTFTPTTPSSTPPSIDSTKPVNVESVLPKSPTDPCATFPTGPTDTIAMGDDCAATFTLNVTGATVVLFQLPPNIGMGQLLELFDVTLGNQEVFSGSPYGASDTFQLTAQDPPSPPNPPGSDVGSTSFTYTAGGPGGVATSNPVNVDVHCDSVDDSTCTTAAAASTSSPPSTTTTSTSTVASPSSPSSGTSTSATTPSTTIPGP